MPNSAVLPPSPSLQPKGPGILKGAASIHDRLEESQKAKQAQLEKMRQRAAAAKTPEGIAEREAQIKAQKDRADRRELAEMQRRENIEAKKRAVIEAREAAQREEEERLKREAEAAEEERLARQAALDLARAQVEAAERAALARQKAALDSWNQARVRKANGRR